VASARTFLRRRDELVRYVADHIDNAQDTRLRRLIMAYCVDNDMPVLPIDIDDVISEAIRRKLIEKIKDLNDKLDQARTAFLALKSKVYSYHPLLFCSSTLKHKADLSNWLRHNYAIHDVTS